MQINNPTKEWATKVTMAILLVAFGFVLFGTCTVLRSDTSSLLASFALLAVLYLFICYRSDGLSKLNVLGIAVIMRLILLPAPILLSDDVNRFHWDGLKTKSGEGPYSTTPSIDTRKEDWAAIYQGINSKNFFSPYPPICQYVWAISAQENGNALLMKFVYLIIDMINVYLLIRILNHHKKPIKWVLWYALNPLVLIEGIGQLHPEVLMLTGLLWVIDALNRRRWQEIPFGLTIAICTKLLPVFAFVFLFKQLKWQRWLVVGFFTALLVVGLYWPLMNKDALYNTYQGALLYYSQFEFNASFYYVLKATIQFFDPTQSGQVVSRILGVLTLIIFFCLMFKKEARYEAILLVFFCLYFLGAAVVHPWYILPIMALGLISGYWTPIVWSFLVLLSYSHYESSLFQEQYFIIALEYTLLLLSFVIELFVIPRISKLRSSQNAVK